MMFRLRLKIGKGNVERGGEMHCRFSGDVQCKALGCGMVEVTEDKLN